MLKLAWQAQSGEAQLVQEKLLWQAQLTQDHAQGLKEAIDDHPQSIKDYREEYLKTIKAPGINIYNKHVEMGTNYCHVILGNKINDELYVAPHSDLLEAVKSEKKKRKVFKVDLNKS